jgi:hypothetical protein
MKDILYFFRFSLAVAVIVIISLMIVSAITA